MSSADLAIVVIACPSCGTRYQVPYGTIAAEGREVQCAQCGKPWHAMAEAPPMPRPPVDPDALFSAADEASLDAAFEAEGKAAPAPAHDPRHLDHERTLAEIRAAIAPKPKPKPVNDLDDKALKEAARLFDRRQRQAKKRLPLARFRRTARLAAFVALLSFLLLGYSLRTDLVRWFPSLAGLYASIGLPVNVVGLTIEDAKTINTLREGKMVMQVSAKIRSIAGQPVALPAVLVSLLGPTGNTLYEWTVAATLKEMEPGEVLDFSTEVNTPPSGASRVRLSFTGQPAGATDKAS
jgi:predicted Zn finger-like uncharacterized protein